MPEQIVVGRGAVLSLGAQGTHASAAATSVDLPVVSINVERGDKWIDRPHLHLGTAGFNRSTRGLVAVRRNLKVKQLLCFSGQGLLLRGALGDAATTGAGPYTHTYTAISLLPMLTAVEHDGTATASVSAYKGTIDSCVVNQLRISGKAGEYAMLETDLMGRAEVRATTTAPTPSDPNPVMVYQGSTLAWNSLTIEITSFNIVVDNALQERPQVGSLYISRPHPGRRSVVMTCELEIVSDALVTALSAGTLSDAVLTITGTGNETMTITLHNAQVLEESTPIDTVDALKRTVKLGGSADGTDQGFKIVIVNDVATAIL